MKDLKYCYSHSKIQRNDIWMTQPCFLLYVAVLEGYYLPFSDTVFAAVS